MKNIRKLLAAFIQIIFLSLIFGNSVFAADLDAQVSKLQVDVNSVEKEISDLEKDLLFPPLTRIEVYLSMVPDLNFSLTSVSLKIDGEEKGFHIYSEGDIAALRLGGMQQFWEGNVALGNHKLEAAFVGVDKKGVKVNGVANIDFEKIQLGRSFELKITAANEEKAPGFSVKDWGNQ